MFDSESGSAQKDTLFHLEANRRMVPLLPQNHIVGHPYMTFKNTNLSLQLSIHLKICVSHASSTLV